MKYYISSQTHIYLHLYLYVATIPQGSFISLCLYYPLVLKTHFKKKEPIVVNCRKYKDFNEQKFRNDLTRKLEILRTGHFYYEDFKKDFYSCLDTHAPKKKVVMRGNNAPLMIKTLSKAFMQRSRLKYRLK